MATSTPTGPWISERGSVLGTDHEPQAQLTPSQSSTEVIRVTGVAGDTAG